MTLNRTSKVKSNDALNAWTHAVFGNEYKKKEKSLIQRARRNAVKRDTRQCIQSAHRDAL